MGAAAGIASPFGYERSSSANPGATSASASHALLLGSGVPPYSLADLQADINRWPAAYYSKQVRVCTHWCADTHTQEHKMLCDELLWLMMVVVVVMTTVMVAMSLLLLLLRRRRLLLLLMMMMMEVRLLRCSQGKEPLLYMTVLLLSLQFHAALRFLWKVRLRPPGCLVKGKAARVRGKAARVKRQSSPCHEAKQPVSEAKQPVSRGKAARIKRQNRGNASHLECLTRSVSLGVFHKECLTRSVLLGVSH